MKLRLAVVRDYSAEQWQSMDLCADLLLAHLPQDMLGIDVAPPFRQFFGRLSIPGRAAFNADRLLNRNLILPQLVRRLAREADAIHIADHSYAHLTMSLPAGRVGVYCHDLDTFRCLFEPKNDPRPSWFRALVRWTLAGLQRSAVVFHNSDAIGRELIDTKLIPLDRLVHASLGVAPEFTLYPTTQQSLPATIRSPYLLHVGGEMPRKRLDVLLDIFAEVRASQPGLQLVQVGQPWSEERSAQIAKLGINDAVVKLSNLSRVELATLYRGAAAVLVPSDTEGFGLPVIEALACGSVVFGSDIRVLRVVGGDACLYLSNWCDRDLG